MSYKKITGRPAFLILASIGAIFTFGMIHIPAAHAADCGITLGDVAQITAIQKDPTLSSDEEVTQELAVRKALVGRTISCAQQEVQTLQATLSSSTVPADVQPLQSQLSGNLSDAGNYYALEMTKLNSVGISGSEAIAQEVLAWRASTFIPLSESVKNFILWSQNQNLFVTAQTRMVATQRAVSFLESNSPDADLQTAFDTAQSSFDDAESQNAQAKEAFAQGLSPKQSLALIRQSLGSLSTTYQNFFTVSTIIKSLLPQ